MKRSTSMPSLRTFFRRNLKRYHHVYDLNTKLSLIGAEKGVGVRSPHSTLITAAIILGIPIVPPLIYSLVFHYPALFVLSYVFGLALYVVGLFAFLVTEVSIRPPWYRPTKKESGLTMEEIPEYWQGVCHNPKYDLDLDYQTVEFPNKETGLVLRGWYIPTEHQSTTGEVPTVGVVFVHGGGRDRRAFLRHVPMFYEENYSCLLFDFSEHGCSDGAARGFSYGIREHRDVIAAADWLKTVKGHQRVVVVGTSVGGASVILAGAAPDGGSIDGVVAENPVAAPDDFAVFHLEKIFSSYLPPSIANSIAVSVFYKFVVFLFLWRIGALFRRAPYAAVDAVEKIAPRPLLLMHGTADEIVPISHSISIKERAKEPVDFWSAQDAWHCALFDKYPDEYREKVVGWLHRHFGSGRTTNEDEGVLPNGPAGPSTSTVADEGMDKTSL